MDKPKTEQRWGWLARIIAAFIVTFFRILESVLKAIFSILSALAQSL